MNDGSNDEIAKARALLSAADRIVVLTGAGVSAESGVPTFRGPGGLWNSFRPEELATPEAFARDPRLVWEWYAWRRSLVAECDPNPAHLSLASMALSRPGHTTIVTQNVDGLHHRAARAIADDRGCAADPGLPIEVHGAIHRDRCSGCGRRSEGRSEVDTTSRDTLPSCTTCGQMLRPDVVWFGEMLDPEVIARSFAAAERADVCLVIGTSALVHPAASIPNATRSTGGMVIEVNLEATVLTAVATLSLLGEAGKLVPAVTDSTS